MVATEEDGPPRSEELSEDPELEILHEGCVLNGFSLPFDVFSLILAKLDYITQQRCRR